jgi:hypothetical protein
MARPLVVAYGGGVNSTALLVGLWQRRLVPDLILFADTGGEKPETYAYRDLFSAWLTNHGFPAIQTVSNDGMYRTLEQNCLATHTLPSLAYGWRSCSDKYKRRPQDKFVAAWAPAREAWALDSKVTKAIGYDAGEARRASIREDARYCYWYALLEWDWDRIACLRAISSVGLPLPPKSACFFCPATTKREVLQLSCTHPNLMERALMIEENAAGTLKTVKGLGRRFAWKDLIEGRVPLQLAAPEQDLPCGCYDGGLDD